MQTIKRSVVNYFPNYSYGGVPTVGYSGYNTTPVANFPPNLFGLYDMHGNLEEWCLDEYVDNYNDVLTDGSARGDSTSRNKNKGRLVRGGSWTGFIEDCRSANRSHSSYLPASSRLRSFGFRVVYSMLSRTS